MGQGQQQGQGQSQDQLSDDDVNVTVNVENISGSGQDDFPPGPPGLDKETVEKMAAIIEEPATPEPVAEETPPATA